MDSFGAGDKETTQPTTASSFAIACPACQTRFLIEQNLLSNDRDSRFHCSRCDTVFSSPRPKLLDKELKQADSRPSNSETRPRLGFSPLSVGAVNPGIRASDFSLTGTANEASRASAQSVDSSPNGTNNSQDISKEKPSTTAPSGLRGWQIFAEDAPLYEAPSSQKRPSETLTNMPEAEPIAQAYQPEFDFSTMSRESTSPSQTTSMERPSYVQARTEAPTRNSRTNTSALMGLLSPFTPKTQGLIVMTTPLVAALALLVGFSYSARLSPLTIGSAASAVAPGFLSRSVPQLPPNGISVRGLSIAFPKTQTKEQLAVISGTVINTSSEAINGVTLEGLGFNSRGEIVASARSPLKSALSREKISDLSLETVRKFQVSLSARKASIAPNEEVPFTIALNAEQTAVSNISELELGDLKYFSARVFSVK